MPATNTVDLTEATERVAVLDQFPFEDSQPNIEAPSLSVLVDAYTDYNYADRGAFETRWTEETQHIAQLVSAVPSPFLVLLLV